MNKSQMSATLWGLYFLFAVSALYLNWHDRIVQFDVPLGALKIAVWLLWIGFLMYSVYCSTRENLMSTVGKMSKLYWGRQIGLDLYLGLFLGFIIIYLNEGSVAVLLWAIPLLLFVNLAMLLYFAIHFDAIVDKFIL